jgi:hypothetical protein
MPYVPAIKRKCELCGGEHRNRLMNICNECRFGNCIECGALLDGNKPRQYCLECYRERLASLVRYGRGGKKKVNPVPPPDTVQEL